MASDKRQYTEALQRWDELKTDKTFSVSPDLGSVAIVCSLYPVQALSGTEEAAYIHDDDPDTFCREAYAIADRLVAEDKNPVVAMDAEPEDFKRVLTDPSISDVIVIGHGDLTAVAMENPENSDAFDWQDVASTANHLKRGQFVQRTCGRHSRDLSVPLGLFAVTDHRNVIAPAGRYFVPTDLDHPHNWLLRSVSQVKRMTYRQIKKNFPLQEQKGTNPVEENQSILS